ncbi:hypothetical protein G4X40_19240 [Rhodococcus sp. D2-41]|uniref:hypothetical protein n=1 Tax=Speluncibacter jeojiensis TaxID=2710754 RepID=UPI00240FC4FB|nr:hypothetical protein [Rhodococcus sp. D2-41]MDG3012279.1 hypothetical protein [Rhodococcus sp. D2-41]
MTEGLDTHVAGDENSCHALAASMSAVAGSVQAGADAFLKARSSSEWVWASGDEFRTKVTAMSNTTDRVEDQCRRFAQALTAFANSLAAVKATMASIRARAVTGMLTVTGETIDFPTLGGASAMVVIDQIKLIAFGEALEGVAAARVAEANAHHALEAALARVTEQLATVPSDPSLVLGNQSAGRRRRARGAHGAGRSRPKRRRVVAERGVATRCVVGSGRPVRTATRYLLWPTSPMTSM